MSAKIITKLAENQQKLDKCKMDYKNMLDTIKEYGISENEAKNMLKTIKNIMNEVNDNQIKTIFKLLKGLIPDCKKDLKKIELRYLEKGTEEENNEEEKEIDYGYDDEEENNEEEKEIDFGTMSIACNDEEEEEIDFGTMSIACDYEDEEKEEEEKEEEEEEEEEEIDECKIDKKEMDNYYNIIYNYIILKNNEEMRELDSKELTKDEVRLSTIKVCKQLRKEYVEDFDIYKFVKSLSFSQCLYVIDENYDTLCDKSVVDGFYCPTHEKRATNSELYSKSFGNRIYVVG